jgi:hypothetical protein
LLEKEYSVPRTSLKELIHINPKMITSSDAHKSVFFI